MMHRWHWRAGAVELPDSVQGESQSISLTRVLYYPYWLLDVTVAIKAPLLSKVRRRWMVAVDAITGIIILPPPMPPFYGEKEAGTGTRYIEPRISVKDVDHSMLHRMAVDQVSRKLRSWMNVKTEIEKTRLVYKEIRLFDVHFNNNSRAVIALDSLTGEYGIIEELKAGEEPWHDREMGTFNLGRYCNKS